VTAGQPRAHWLAACEQAGVPAGPINSVPEALADPHVRARNMVRELAHPTAGRVPALGNPVKMSLTPPALETAAPALGQHTDAVLRELGYTEAEIATLRAQAIVA
jgi:formyl-CoA transferase